jgi:hypothetical protein
LGFLHLQWYLCLTLAVGFDCEGFWPQNLYSLLSSLPFNTTPLPQLHL